MTSDSLPAAPVGEAAAAPASSGASTPLPPIELGAVVAGKYRVERVLGFGGMGIVCAATHLELASPIAIKFVRPEHGSDERAVARFLTEARAAARLQSQHTCRVTDVGRLPTGSPYIVMEYLSGENLQTRVERLGPLDFHEVATLALQACEALGEAHAKHIVHRDIKPENLFVIAGPDGSPLLKVLDFGISKQVSPLATPRTMNDSMESVGSPYHMSPEQMTDPSSVDARSDIWSLGVVMYELLTGQLPFAGESAPQLCVNVMTTQPIPPQAHRVEIPDRLAQVLRRCLDKDREGRFQDVGQLARALTEFAGPGGQLSAERVERILGRSPSDTAPPTALDAEPTKVQPQPQPQSSQAGLARPRGVGLRVGVGAVLLGATALAALAAYHSLSPAEVAVPVATATRPALQPLSSLALLGEPASSPRVEARSEQKKPRRAARPAPSARAAGATTLPPPPARQAPPDALPLASPSAPSTPLVATPAPSAPPVAAPPASAPVVTPAPSPPDAAPLPGPRSSVVYPKIPLMPDLPPP
jgi:eukaryotic-like serine/threonine-protein kinase